MKKVLLITGLVVAGSAAAYEKVYLDRLLETRQCNFCNLSEADLSSQDLTGADMS